MDKLERVPTENTGVTVMKKVIILNHNGGRMANQLWSFVSIYAYCLEKGWGCVHTCFFEYSSYFKYDYASGIGSVLSFVFRALKKFLPRRVARKCVYILHGLYTFWCRKVLQGSRLITSDGTPTEESFYLLPPTAPAGGDLKTWEDRQDDSSLYLSGWRFRNTVGLLKFRARITQAFAPKDAYAARITQFVAPLRLTGRELVGVHVRQGDYKTWQHGLYYFNSEEVRNILDSYAEYAARSGKEVFFIVCSDGPIDEAALHGLSYIRGLGTEIEDLFTLAATDVIIGAHSTYGTLAAYFGNVPFYTFSRGRMDWASPDNIFLI